MLRLKSHALMSAFREKETLGLAWFAAGGGPTKVALYLQQGLVWFFEVKAEGKIQGRKMTLVSMCKALEMQSR